MATGATAAALATLSTSAPGKLILAGEYAVLGGAEAVVAAVDRRAVARLVAAGQPAPVLSPFLAAARDAIAAVWGPDSVAARAAARVVVDSSGMASGGRKLGLGSSAAATVAAVACALAADRADSGAAALDRDEVHRLARAAHAAAQGERGARGSGADVASACHGGVIGVRGGAGDGGGAVRTLVLPADLRLIAVWTGIPADTATLVMAVERLRARDAGAHAAHMAAIAAAATALAEAWRAEEAIGAIAAGAAALAALSTDVEAATGAVLEPEVVRRLRAIAARHGGAAKTTGAGGGDVAIVAVADGPEVERVRQEVAAAGMELVDVALGAEGVRIEARG